MRGSTPKNKRAGMASAACATISVSTDLVVQTIAPPLSQSNKSATHSEQLSPQDPTHGRRRGLDLFQYGASEGAGLTQVLRVRWAQLRWIVGCSWALLAWPTGAAPCTDLPALAWQTVLPGVAVVHGQWHAVTPDGRSHAATTVVLGQNADVTVIDPGPTYGVGQALQKDLKCRHPASSVTRLINTHAHAEQVLANAAWVPEASADVPQVEAAKRRAAPVVPIGASVGVVVAATLGTQQAMRQRCPDCLAALQHDLGEQASRGTRIVLPTQVLQDGQGVQAGGRSWQVHDMRHAHTESDLVLWSAQEGIVLAGGLVDGDVLPVLAQGSVRGWLHALDRMRAWQPQWLVGQHLVRGPGQVQAALQRQQHYLCSLVRYAWQGLERGWSEAEAVQQVPWPAAWHAGAVPEQSRPHKVRPDRSPLLKAADLPANGQRRGDPSKPAQQDKTHEAWTTQQRQQHVFNQLRAWREVELSWLDQADRANPWPALCESTPDVGR